MRRTLARIATRLCGACAGSSLGSCLENGKQRQTSANMTPSGGCVEGFTGAPYSPLPAKALDCGRVSCREATTVSATGQQFGAERVHGVLERRRARQRCASIRNAELQDVWLICTTRMFSSHCQGSTEAVAIRFRVVPAQAEGIYMKKCEGASRVQQTLARLNWSLCSRSSCWTLWSLRTLHVHHLFIDADTVYSSVR